MAAETTSQTGRQYAGVPAQDRRNERRERLLQAGITLFGSAGYAATSINAVCAEADLTKRYFYESFDNGDAFLIAVYEKVTQRTQDAVVTAMMSAPPDDLAEAARTGARAFFETIDADKEAARVLLAEVLGVSPAVDAAYRASIDTWVVLIATALEGHDYHGLRTDLLASTIWGLIFGTALRWCLTAWAEDVEDITTVVETVLTDVASATTAA